VWGYWGCCNGAALVLFFGIARGALLAACRFGRGNVETCGSGTRHSCLCSVEWPVSLAGMLPGNTGGNPCLCAVFLFCADVVGSKIIASMASAREWAERVQVRQPYAARLPCRRPLWLPACSPLLPALGLKARTHRRGTQAWHTGVAHRRGTQAWHTGVAVRSVAPLRSTLHDFVAFFLSQHMPHLPAQAALEELKASRSCHLP